MDKNTKYESCKVKIMNKIMKEYEQEKIKTRNKKKITSRKQAVAIGLSISNKSCEKLFTDEDYRRIENRYNKNMYNDKGDLKDDKISYTTIVSGKKLIDYYKNKKQYKKSNKIKDDLVKRVLKRIEKGEINRRIINELILIIG